MYMTDFYHAIVRSVIQSASMDIVPPDAPVQALGLITANLIGVIRVRSRSVLLPVIINYALSLVAYAPSTYSEIWYII